MKIQTRVWEKENLLFLNVKMATSGLPLSPPYILILKGKAMKLSSPASHYESKAKRLGN